jgi:two-component system nitrate/nitrite response regulator NarL
MTVMTEADKPKTQLETGRGGPGPTDPTAVGGDDDGSFEYALVSSKLDHTSNKPRAVICEPHYLIRHGLIARLRYTIRVVGETADGVEALALIRSTVPNILLINVEVGIEHALNICELFSEGLKILVLTDSYHATRYAKQLKRAGIHGLCLHSCNDARLLEAVGWTLAGEQFIDGNLRPWLEQSPIRCNDLSEELNEDEVEVLIRMCLPDEAIAEELNIEVDEVAAVTERILRKLRVSRSTAAVVKAMQMGYLMLPKTPGVNDKGVSVEHLAAEEMALRAIGESARAD